MKNFFKNPNILNCILYLVLKLTNGIEKKNIKRYKCTVFTENMEKNVQ